jgi:DNA polymerase I-like protein with 3'-5' exonuclease and polymerase domains
MPPDPNLQKVPIGGTLRDHICTPEGRVFVIMDYFSLESRIVAETSL